ncbi:2-C-methyl-D-erythritol 4-phosphate cytidylyltransferase [Mucilaginibacter arboris]|uniref:2-C-methyl-D-erythritol 4-phosphate cytidylyltransferase n=1 Tax=Mucilaginibacter arboris TaxID=2682090 RepID=A0A7K1SVV1_9SPHI|nr:2-C-methyl-D-erythritol 4-phosphate cytidylyltransferase [Mucilaginibacter arboris]MVN21462.1 2-C-methyl-D-erythritol 4-phosphate cytidylyltransferase [Mucilaginibacter arboris]
MKFFAVIVAGGSGTRMNAQLPKQFMLLAGKPVIMHTITAFSASAEKPEIMVVLNKQQFSFWEQLCAEHQFTVPHTLIAGGNTRFQSVKNAIDTINETSVIAIHDAVRPLISTAIISKAYQQALTEGNSVVAVPSKDSVRWQKANGVSQNLNRNEVFLVQTPQTFQSEMIKKAYQQEYKEEFTDDASVAESFGIRINLLPGDPDNFKITFPADLLMAELILNEKSR